MTHNPRHPTKTSQFRTNELHLHLNLLNHLLYDEQTQWQKIMKPEHHTILSKKN